MNGKYTTQNKGPRGKEFTRLSFALQNFGGFTLVETLVAISILLLAVMAPLTIAHHGIASTSFARDQVIATYLAQDAIEAIITQKRQNALLRADNWLNNMSGCPVDCIVNPLKIGQSNFTESCNVTCPIKYDDSSGMYGYDTGNPTKFTRTVAFENVQNNSDEAKVTVTVSWKSSLLTKSFSIKTNIFNTQL